MMLSIQTCHLTLETYTSLISLYCLFETVADLQKQKVKVLASLESLTTNLDIDIDCFLFYIFHTNNATT